MTEPIVEFKAWEKIPRDSNETVVITEKLDGTNACVVIQDGVIVAVQSRKRFICIGADNYGFAGWVEVNNDDLLTMGDGYHYGEWVGLGINKNPHELKDKRFYLFNSGRWGVNNPDTPKCVYVVPVLAYREYTNTLVDETMATLKESGSHIGGSPEGVVTYYTRTRRYAKTTYDYKGYNPTVGDPS